MIKNYKSTKNNLKILLTLFLLIFQLFSGISYSNKIAWAEDTKNSLDEIYISENNYTEDMEKIVEPYINSRLESGYVDGDEGVKLYYEKYKVDDPKLNIEDMEGLEH